MTEFRTIPPQLTKDEWNALLDHGLEKPMSYIIRKTATRYEAINGRTGKIDYYSADLTDASTVIQSAYDALPLSGGALFFKTGKYILTKKLVFDRGAIRLISESRGWHTPFEGGVIFTIDAESFPENDPMIKLTGSAEATQLFGGIENIYFRGQNHAYGIQYDTPNHFRDTVIKRCIFNGCKKAILVNAPLANLWIVENWIEYSTLRGIHLVGPRNVWISRNLFANNPCDIEINTAKYIHVVNNHTEVCDSFVYFHGGYCRWSYFTHNILYNFKRGFRASSTGNLERVNICHNIADTALVKFFEGTAGFTLSDVRISGNILSNITEDPHIDLVDQTAEVKSNIGYVTESSGTATIASGTSSIVVNHGLATTPSIVIVTGEHSETVDCYVTNKTASQFTINVPSNVTADRTVMWKAEV